MQRPEIDIDHVASHPVPDQPVASHPVRHQMMPAAQDRRAEERSDHDEALAGEVVRAVATLHASQLSAPSPEEFTAYCEAVYRWIKEDDEREPT